MDKLHSKVTLFSRDPQTQTHKHMCTNTDIDTHTHMHIYIHTHGLSVRFSAKPLSAFVWKHDTHPPLYILVVKRRNDFNS